MTLERVVVVTDCEDLEQVDIMVEAYLEWLRVEVHSVWSGVGLVGAEVAE